jgi:membrane-bound lytic murein transglycosylase D
MRRPLGWSAPLVGALALSACAGRVPAPPVLPPAPDVELADGPFEDFDANTYDLALQPPPYRPERLPDPILDSPWARHPEMESRVAYWMGRWQRRGVFDLPVSLGRMGYYQEVIDRELETRGLPESLKYLPVIESGYHAGAVSRVGATGLWQLMGPTARSLGLRVNSLVDERRDPFSSTAVALDYLLELNQRFGSWFLTLAAYNAGPYRVESLLRRHAPDAPLTDATFWRIRRYLPAETRDFVPKFIAAARIGESPESHGFEVTRAEALAFEQVAVPDAVSVDVLARAAETPQEVIERLNPHLVRGLTPVGVETVVRVPPGQGEVFTRNWALIPESERISFLEHRIARGETLSAVAQTYRVRLADLQAANPRLNPRRLQVGQTVIIPRIPAAGSGTRVAVVPPAPSGPAVAAIASPSAGGTLARGGDGGAVGAGVGTEGVAEPAEVVHRVASGESLWSISRRYGVSMDALRAWNGLGTRPVLQVGQSIVIRTGGEAVSVSGAPRVHVVRRGDTLGAIARRYGVGTAGLARENGLTLRSTIRPGDRLRIPAANQE